MKKLMLICSLACVFLLGATDLSAQYVSADEAIQIVKHELSELQEATTVSNGSLGTQAEPSVDTQVKVYFLGRVLKNLSKSNAEVQGSIDAVYADAIANTHPLRHATFLEVKEFTEELLAD